jgi:Cdc6-like AAA superfamily ATPase
MRSFFRKRRQLAGTGGFDTDLAELDEPTPIAELQTFRHERPAERPSFRMADIDARPAPAAAVDGAAPRRLSETLDLLDGGQARAAPAEPTRDRDAEELPRFHLPVSTGLRGGPAGRGLDADLNRTLREAFTPTRPKQEVNGLFVGRLGTLRRIIAAIEEERAHVVVFGDRGRGKTSLANAVEQIAGQAGYLVLKLTCSAELSFEDIFRSFLRRIPSTYAGRPSDAPFSTKRSFTSFDERLPAGGFSVTQLNEVMAEIGGTHVLLILDEYDRVTNEDLKNKLAELIKNLTDSSIQVTLLVVGVAENIDQLLGKHPSIQRSLVAVHLPLMTDREIERIIQAGAEAAGLAFATDVRQRIVELAKGLPYYAQLLSLHAARAAITRGIRTVEPEDLAEAVKRCVIEAERGLVEDYHKAIGPEADSERTDTLYLAAQCHADEFGAFRVAEMMNVPIRPGPRALVPARIEEVLADLCQGERALIQRVIVPGGYRYRFRNQMMRQFVLLIQAEDRGLV